MTSGPVSTEPSGSAANSRNVEGESGRTRKTHIPRLLDLLKSLSLLGKIKKNKAIEEQNDLRKQMTLDHALDPVAYPDPGSEEASLLTIDSADMRCLKVPSFLSSVKGYMYEGLARRIADEEAASLKEADTLKRKAPPEPEKSSSSSQLSAEQIRVNKRKCMDGKLLKPRLQGATIQLEFPDIMFETEFRTALPLNFFLNKNITYITLKEYTLPTFKANPANGEAKGSNILHIEKLKEIFGKEEDMQESEWIEAAENHHRFQQLRDVDGPDGAHAKWYELNYNFFLGRDDRNAYYHSWKYMDIKKRADHIQKKECFDYDQYETDYSIVVANAELEKRMTDLINSSRSSHTASRENGNDKPVSGSSKTTTRGPFPSGSGRPQSSPSTCLICSERGHTAKHHLDEQTPAKFADGKPTWAKFTSRNLVTPDNRVLCVNWNTKGQTRAVCSHSKDERAHLCSFCGNKTHHAFSWTCRGAPTNK